MSTTAFKATYYEASCKPGATPTTPGKLYRDSSGRIRIDHFIEIGSLTIPLFRKIYDPIQNALFVLNDSKRTVLALRHPAGVEAAVIGIFPMRNHGADPTPEDLGTSEIEGLLCQGTRLGTAEYWYSNELNLPVLATEDGELRMKICDIVFTEPDPELFAIPEDYENQKDDETK